MLDIKYIRENLEKVKKALSKKHTQFDLDGLLKLDDERKDLQRRVEILRAEQNKLAKEGKKTQRAVEIKKMLSDLEPKLNQAEEAYLEEAAKIHNIPHESVPSKQEGTKVVRKRGDLPKFSFEPKTHIQLGKELDIIDIERAAKVCGTRFGYFKNEAVMLEWALVNWLFEKLTKKNFIPVIPPVLVREKAMFGTGFFPAEKIEYYKTDQDLYLVGTAEVPLAAYHSDEILQENELPKKYLGFSTCFRREAGTYGKDTYGMLRVHQFDKIEQFIFANPENSWEEFEKLQENVEEIMQELKLPYQVVNICGGDLGAPNAKKYDTEVWIPGQKKYRELTSCSHDTDFQARRLNIKFRKKDGTTDYVHTLNATACAIGRTIIAILENYQQKDGSIKIPEVLIKYTSFKEIRK